MLREVLEHAKQELHLPRIIGERCVHTLVENATCERCVEACPHNAWLLNDEMLGVKTEQCDGCGLCVPACPQGALIHEHQPLSRNWRGRQIAFAACERAEPGEPKEVIPCLQAFGLQDLLHLYRQGYTDLVTTSGDCDDCPRGNASRLESLIKHINQMLMSRELPPMRLQPVPPKQWKALLERTSPESKGPGLNRRGFLTHAVKGGAVEVITLAGLADLHQREFIPPGELLSGEVAGHVLPNVPVMDIERCDGCDACVNTCPHGAIKLVEPEAGAVSYRIDASRCTGCSICEDICEQKAVSIEHWTLSHQVAVDLKAAQCRRCGALYHRPDRHDDDTNLCRICVRVNHYQNLYQVLD